MQEFTLDKRLFFIKHCSIIKNYLFIDIIFEIRRLRYFSIGVLLDDIKLLYRNNAIKLKIYRI